MIKLLDVVEYRFLMLPIPYITNQVSQRITKAKEILHQSGQSTGGFGEHFLHVEQNRDRVAVAAYLDMHLCQTTRSSHICWQKVVGLHPKHLLHDEHSLDRRIWRCYYRPPENAGC